MRQAVGPLVIHKFNFWKIPEWIGRIYLIPGHSFRLVLLCFTIQELMEEGRKLSVQLGNANTALRKLRAKEKENEGVSQRRKEKAEAAEKRVEELEASLEEVGKREKTKTSRLEQLEEKVKILETIKFEAESQMEDDKEKMESLKVGAPLLISVPMLFFRLFSFFCLRRN